MILALVDEKMLRGKRGDLGQVSYTKHLLAAAEGLEFLPHGFGSPAANADIDFIEDQGSGRGGFLLRLRCALFHCDFESQHDARHFTTGSYLVERFERLARGGGDAVLNVVPAVRGPTRSRA